MFAGLFLRSCKPYDPQKAQRHWRKSFAIFGNGIRSLSQKGGRFQLFVLQIDHRSSSLGHDCLHHCPETGFSIAIWGRLDNRQELISALPDADPASSDAELVLSGWQKWGRALPQNLLGDFAIAIVSSRDDQLFLIRDPMGVKPLFYRIDQDLIAFASTASALKLPGLPLTPDRRWIARYLWMNLSTDPERTAYSEISKLPGGSCLAISGDTEPSVSRWHDWDRDQFGARERDDSWVADYRNLLDKSVATRISGEEIIGVESTGGLDSSAILASTALNHESPTGCIHAYGNALSEQERVLIQASSDACHIEHTHLNTERNAISDQLMKLIIGAIGYPEENGTASSYASFYEHASKQKIKVLLSGFGGDEIVSNPGFLARQEFVDTGNFGALLSSFDGSVVGRAMRMAKFVALGQRATQMSAAQNKMWHERWLLCLLRDEVIEEFEIAPAFFNTVRNDAVHKSINKLILDSHLHKMAMTTRLENCTLVAALWGVEYRWPLLDARLIQQYLTTPAIEKFGPRGTGRYLHRRAMDGRLPDEIVWKKNKSMGPSLPIDKKEFLPLGWERGGWLRDGLPADLVEFVDPAKLAHGIQIIENATGQLTHEMMAMRSSLVALRWLSNWFSSDDFLVPIGP